MSLNSSTGVISGTPTASGSFNVTIAVTDRSSPSQTATQALALSITPKLVTNTTFAPVGSAVASRVPTMSLVQGGTAPYNCSVSSGSLPPGITLNATACTIGGTPTSAGYYTFGLSVTDSSSPVQTASATYSNWMISDAVEITNRTLPPLISGAYTFSATGGAMPYAYSDWTVASGALPSGWTLNPSTGVLAAPTANTTATFGLTVQDIYGNTSAVRSFTTVPPATTTTTLSATAAPIVFGHAATLTATVAPAAASGKVTFFDGTTILGTSTLSGGVATLTTRMLAQGARSLHAYYEGAAGYAGSGSAAVARSILSVPQSGFAAPQSYTTAAYPEGSVSGDFNGDGKPDLAVANGSGIEVLLGNGDGTFQAAIHVSGASGVLAAGDFNGDGKLDLVFTSSILGAVQVMLGNGDGTFQPAVGYGAGTMGISITVGDVNGDGITDLVVTETGRVDVLIGNGDGTFYPAVQHDLTLSGLASGIAIGDFNRDGIADLAVSVYSSYVQVLLGNGDGTFEAGVNYGGGGNGVPVVADFNGDGFLDIASASGVILGTGTGTFGSLIAYPASLNGQPAVGDFNGDGKPDLAIATTSTQGASTGFSLLFGNGDGTFAAPVAYSGTYAHLVAVDFNGDGRADLAAETSSGVSILLGLAPLTLTCSPAAGPVYTGTAWSTGCSATGGTAAYTFSIGAGTLPAGLSLNGATGAITGTPTGSGSYAFTVQVTDSSSPVQSATQAFSGTLSPAPSSGGGGGGGGGSFPISGSSLTAMPTSLTFNSSPGNPPAAQTFTISSTVAGTTFTAGAVTNGGTWLSVSPASGATDTQGTLTVSVNPSALGQGTYMGTVNVNTSQGGTASVAVVLNVQAQFTASPSAVSFVYSAGDTGARTTQGISIFSNPNGIPVTASAAASGAGWLSVSGPAASATPSSVVVSVNPSGLIAGTYTSSVTISSALAASISVPVSLIVVNAAPKLSVAPATQSFTLNQGSGAAAGQVMISNAGGGTLQYSAQASAGQGNWRMLSGAGSGTATPSTPGSLGFAVNPAGLMPGQYTGQIVVTNTASQAQATATIVLSVSQASQSLGISETGLSFSAIAGAQKPPRRRSRFRIRERAR